MTAHGGRQTTFLGEGDGLQSVVCALPPEHRERLSFHLPMEVQALEVAGATEEQIGERIALRLPEAFSATLVDPPAFRWYEREYRPLGATLATEDREVARLAFQEVGHLAGGLCGGAFHPLIRVGYGILRRDSAEVGRGLAYLRSRRQPLAIAGYGKPGRRVALPSGQDLASLSVIDQLTLVAGDAGASMTPEAPATPAELCQEAMALVRKDASSFVAVHALTGLHALVEIDHRLTGRSEVAELPDDALLAPWWAEMGASVRACRLIVDATADGTSSARAELPESIDELLRASIATCEAHDVKVMVALRRLVELGVTTTAEAISTGQAKLSAAECIEPS